ncbi:DUF2384 domain-containing protein [Mangrovimicrobium sediminis]|uniref:DUF2384 domain-containing protein n=1 Tax=Mangrovimicrobium sediminis TaxID=2562682 RepID=A0A4Z0M1B3_9GAMM|nr:MbcA/ParS/Xre antitoxin family protein [Haliea sp. SAOS-164]TGD73331.1 DUF2384 domain-containing protein [Haliea sp. SAOS-164]
MQKALAETSDAELVTHALVEAGRELGLNLGQLARVIGVSDSSMKNYSRGAAAITAAKQQELSLGLVRVYRALFAILGGDSAQMQHWMHTPNRHFQEQAPAALVQSYQGLAELNVYLDAMRGRL